MENFSDTLITENAGKKSVLAAGLDPDISYFPRFIASKIDSYSLESVKNAIVQFNTIVIDSAHQNALAVKPRPAFYEENASARRLYKTTMI